jgi:hypothetical protein
MWTSKGVYDLFALVIKILGINWQPNHIAIGLFQASHTFGHALTKDLIKLLSKYDLKKKSLLMLKTKYLI